MPNPLPQLPFAASRRSAGLLVAGVVIGVLADGTLVRAQSGGVVYACVFDNPTGPAIDGFLEIAS